jgi:hypothetical protein
MAVVVAGHRRCNVAHPDALPDKQQSGKGPFMQMALQGMMRRPGALLTAVAVAFSLNVALGVLPTRALAAKADVVGVKLQAEGTGAWTVEVAVRSKVLGTRVLLHPHEDEQPFTRSLGGVVIPPDVGTVRVRAHDKLEGWGGAEMTVRVPR